MTHGEKSILEVYEDQGFLILALGSNIKIYSCTVESKRSSTEATSSQVKISMGGKNVVVLDLLS